MIKTILKINGMSCSHCVGAVDRLINELEGIESINITLPDNAEIVFDETKTSESDLIKTINDSEIYKVI